MDSCWRKKKLNLYFHFFFFQKNRKRKEEKKMTWRKYFVSGNLPCFISVLWLYSLLVSFIYPKNFIYLNRRYFILFFAGDAKASSTQALNLRLNLSCLSFCSCPLTHCLWCKWRKELCPDTIIAPLICLTWPFVWKHVRRWRQNRCRQETPAKASWWLIYKRMLWNTRSTHQLLAVSEPYFNMSVQICCLFFVCVFAVKLLLSWRMKFKNFVGEKVYTVPQLLFGK